MQIRLANGDAIDLTLREFSRFEPYKLGAEIAFECWADFMHGRTMDVRRDVPGYHLDGHSAAECEEIRRGFAENLDNAALIEASQHNWRR